MFKRANKVTALLVAAASIMSVVPVMAADSTTRLGTKDGTITSAIAFKDGKYVYRGYRTDDDSEAIYYNAGDKDKALSDVEDANIEGTFGTKSAYVKDGSDEYLIDLSNGTVTDETTPEDTADTAATKLKTALKKTDRYGQVSPDASDLSLLAGPKFAETWYSYAISPITRQANSVGATGTGTLYGFTNDSGKYIDASNLANIYAYSSTKNKNVKVGEFNDPDSDTGLTAVLAGAPTVLTQDKDYIYAVVNVYVTDSKAEDAKNSHCVVPAGNDSRQGRNSSGQPKRSTTVR